MHEVWSRLQLHHTRSRHRSAPFLGFGPRLCLDNSHGFLCSLFFLGGSQASFGASLSVI